MANQSPEYNFIGIYGELLRLSYHQLREIVNMERNLYSELEKAQDNVVGLIVMLQCQIMQGNITKAKGLAHKIWSIGGDIPPVIEYAYIENLLNLGMLDMAMVLLKPRIADMNNNLDVFAPLVARFAVMTGNLNILEKLAFCSPDYSYKIFADFAAVYKELDYADHFKNLQKLIFGQIKEHLASYEYKIYFDRGFMDLQAVIYLIDDAYEIPKIKADIDRKVEGYFTSLGKKQLHNYSFVLRNIAEHPAYYGND